MSGSVFDPPLWAAVVEAVVDLFSDPVSQGVSAGSLFTTIKLIWREGLTK
jgi:hypothetical protein